MRHADEIRLDRARLFEAGTAQESERTLNPDYFCTFQPNIT
jgi:hypothetical protein